MTVTANRQWGNGVPPPDDSMDDEQPPKVRRRMFDSDYGPYLDRPGDPRRPDDEHPEA